MSMGTWAYYSPVKIYFGRRCRVDLAEVVVDQHVLVVCSSRARQQIQLDPLLAEAIRCAKSIVWMDSVESNPDINHLQCLADGLRGVPLDCVVAFGGGSAIDSGKALSIALSSRAGYKSLRELLKTCARLPLGVALPLYVLPTTAGTGSEVTPFATIWDRTAHRKLSLAGPAVYPHTAFIDPELCDKLPTSVTLNTGLDAINQAAESIWNRNMTPLSEIFAHRALKNGMEALPKLVESSSNSELRNTMTEVSMLAGLAISQTRTSLCHAISYPLTAHFGIPHGLACAFSMPAVLRLNLLSDDGRFKRLAGALLNDDGSDATERLVTLFDRFNSELRVASKVRSAIGDLDKLLSLSNEMFAPGRADNSLTEVTRDNIQQVLQLSWHTCT